ncbi:alpha-L-arabinofuranosidase domain protein [Halosimplex carlsbadense 2-9-1]|uniref:non-reducing end alpha-L-arabinofuranosidase n=1 Tax=Halosimplex carlsbadense 2-9-1 TaxID=797114 RepID=M0CW73_9EURY|nr:alpha-L-arabinofuranosidase C-terminal domain-containing protein [Halosimplex carlsbadense]ELZ26898.1 alpha-L-arabinofuranosidase domain protein [Halosimplex carlsbadense 2-9-1]
MANAHVTVHTEAGIDRIEPELHGHFAEHLGRCIYDGIYTDDSVEAEGFREDVVDLLEDLEMPVLRWPGGCFADDYQWEDGVGPVEERPRRRNLFWGQGREMVPEESNRFGTDEFLGLCERLGTDPYLAVNVGSGDPQEATDWVEYCNYDGDTELADRRRENGHEDPYGVRYWGIGNENWGCGGNMGPEQYAGEYRQFATYIGSMDGQLLDDGLELIGCGFSNHEWNRRFMEDMVDGIWLSDLQMDHLTLHHYYGRTMSILDGDDDDYDQFLAGALALDDHVERIAGTIEATASTENVGVIVDEWGAWHTEADPATGLEQPGTVLDALSAAAVLDIFNDHADVMTMSNIAQTVNVLQCLVETQGDDAFARPTYRVYDLYAPHKGNEAVTTSIDTPTREVDDGELPLVGASASVDDDGEVYVTATNLDTRAAHTVEFTVEDTTADDVEASVLFEGQDADLVVDADNAEEFTADDLDVSVDGDGTVTAELEPGTVAGIAVE